VILGVAGAKGAPGATTISLGIASTWRRRGAVVLVEADPDGGCVAARLGLSQEPGLGTLAAAGRHELSEHLLAQHLQGAPGGLAVVVAPSSPAHARSALRALEGTLGRALAGLRSAQVVVDLGRLDAESPALALAGWADRVLFVAEPTLEGADALAVRLAELGDLRRRASLVSVGEGPYISEEIAGVLAIEPAGRLPRDPRSAELLWRSPEQAARSRRPLLRALAQMGDHLAPSESSATAYEGERAEDPGRPVELSGFAREAAP
jgi:hypothetical protein